MRRVYIDITVHSRVGIRREDDNTTASGFGADRYCPRRRNAVDTYTFTVLHLVLYRYVYLYVGVTGIQLHDVPYTVTRGKNYTHSISLKQLSHYNIGDLLCFKSEY